MKEIQEKRLESELTLLSSAILPTKYKKINKEEYLVETQVPANLAENVNNDITFIIQMGPNFPFNQPRVFCKTPVII